MIKQSFSLENGCTTLTSPYSTPNLCIVHHTTHVHTNLKSLLKLKCRSSSLVLLLLLLLLLLSFTLSFTFSVTPIINWYLSDRIYLTTCTYQPPSIIFSTTFNTYSNSNPYSYLIPKHQYYY